MCSRATVDERMHMRHKGKSLSGPTCMELDWQMRLTDGQEKALADDQLVASIVDDIRSDDPQQDWYDRPGKAMSTCASGSMSSA